MPNATIAECLIQDKGFLYLCYEYIGHIVINMLVIHFLLITWTKRYFLNLLITLAIYNMN